MEHYKRVLNVHEIMEWVKKRPVKLNSKLVVAIVAAVKREKGPEKRF